MPRLNLTLVYKKEIAPKIYFLLYTSEYQITQLPGQFFSLEIAPKAYRPYSSSYWGQNLPDYYQELSSVPSSAGGYLGFLVNTKPGGAASVYFDATRVGDSVTALGPGGRFGLIDSPNPKIFIATSTGLAPFVPMIKYLLTQDPTTVISLYFGAWVIAGSFAEDFLSRYLDQALYPNFKLITVVDNFQPDDAAKQVIPGRVTTVVPNDVVDFTATDFYLCGNPSMITDMVQILESKGAQHIYYEKFGIK